MKNTLSYEPRNHPKGPRNRSMPETDETGTEEENYSSIVPKMVKKT